MQLVAGPDADAPRRVAARSAFFFSLRTSSSALRFLACRTSTHLTSFTLTRAAKPMGKLYLRKPVHNVYHPRTQQAKRSMLSPYKETKQRGGSSLA